jgi:hypothetical protein
MTNAQTTAGPAGPFGLMDLNVKGWRWTFKKPLKPLRHAVQSRRGVSPPPHSPECDYQPWRIGPLIRFLRNDVHFTPESGHVHCASPCPLWAAPKADIAEHATELFFAPFWRRTSHPVFGRLSAERCGFKPFGSKAAL